MCAHFIADCISTRRVEKAHRHQNAFLIFWQWRHVSRCRFFFLFYRGTREKGVIYQSNLYSCFESGNGLRENCGVKSSSYRQSFHSVLQNSTWSRAILETFEKVRRTKKNLLSRSSIAIASLHDRSSLLRFSSFCEENLNENRVVSIVSKYIIS